MRIFTFITLLLLTSYQVGAQINTGSLPHSFRTNMQMFDKDLHNEIIPTVDMNAIHAEDAERAVRGKVPFDGRKVAVNFNLSNSGTWFKLDEEASIWKLKITSIDAQALELYYSDFFMPPGGELHVYSENGEEYYGAYTEANNHETGAFASEIIQGQTIIVEYYEPHDVAGEGRVNINNVAHIYRNVIEGARGGDDCEVPVNCPEGDAWQDQKRGVVRIRMSGNNGGTFLCSGSLVNNTAQDCKPYVLSAYHCADDPSITSAQYATFRFYFNYERPTCVIENGECNCSGVVTQNQTILGCTLSARSQNANSGSDFILFELSEDVPQDYNPFYNGWNLQSTTITGGAVGIHHPGGFPKKISTSTNNVTSSNFWSGQPSHWRIVWTGTEYGHGVTEGGSSGSPLFDSNKLVIGTLSGGSSFCNSVQPGGQNQPDYYGKISWSWDQNTGGSVIDLKLKLDPINTGQSVLLGSNSPCTTSINEEEIADQISLFPNPTNGQLNLDLGKYVSNISNVIVYNTVGKKITEKVITNSLTSIDLSSESKGLYLIVIVLENQNQITKKVSVY